MSHQVEASKASAEPSAISSSDLAFFERLVLDELAIQLTGKEYLVESRLQPLLAHFGEPDLTRLFARIRSGDSAVKRAALEAMTTNETSFFRDQHPFELLKSHVIPGVLERGGAHATLTIWNGACSSGQESYSLAMTILESFPELARPGRTTIISTDVSTEMVERCKTGEYSRFEVNRGMPSNYAVKFFEQAGRNWVAKRELREMIKARELNLLHDWKGVPRCDLVLMRNVLIYFPTPVKQDVLRRIRTDALKPSGCLILGASESTLGLDAGYKSARVENSTYFFPEVSQP